MTSEMVFECLVVSEDIRVLSVMNWALDRLSIDVEGCPDPVKALEVLAKRDMDLVVCDFSGVPDEMNLLTKVLTSDRKRRSIVLAVVDGPFLAIGAKKAGVDVVIQKPLTLESSAQALNDAYSRMVREERRNARHGIMKPVLAKNKRGELLPVTIADIGERGVGSLSKLKLEVGELLSFDLVLPDAATPISVEVRLLWMRHNMAGADFEYISSTDLRSLCDWLASRVRRGRLSNA